MDRILYSVLGGVAGLAWLTICASTVAVAVGTEGGAAPFAGLMFLTFAAITYFAIRRGE
jgi:hypothetical protein